MEKWSFGNDNDDLIKLVLDGKKTATTPIEILIFSKKTLTIKLVF